MRNFFQARTGPTEESRTLLLSWEHCLNPAAESLQIEEILEMDAKLAKETKLRRMLVLGTSGSGKVWARLVFRTALMLEGSTGHFNAPYKGPLRRVH